MVRVIRKQISKDDEKAIATKKVVEAFSHFEEEQEAANLAQSSGLPYVDLSLFPVNLEDLRIISEKDARENKLASFQKIGSRLKVAIIEPTNAQTNGFIEKLKKEDGYAIDIFVVSQSSMNRTWDRYRSNVLLESLDTLHLSLSGKDLENFEKEFGDLLDLKKRIKEIPTTQVINVIMAGAIKMRASDIHFEPQEKEVRLRYRIDGMLQDIGYFPHEVYRFILTRIKMMGHLKINIRNIAQDGHFKIDLDNNRIDVRVNSIPGNFGESLVMRLLNQSDIVISVEDLGLQGLAYDQVRVQSDKPNGMILTTGPTGSGKTTTLYALINKLNTPSVKIITIEDPIEYEVKGISQTQIDKNRGYTFAKGLRAIVRQDPDVILVGEIRDDETADIAVNASLTGHLVLSTLHTNSAAASIPRMIEMGVKPSLISPSVNAFIAQRLVRKLCDCKEKYKPAENTVDSLKKMLALISPKAKVEIPKQIEYLYRPNPKGCSLCHGFGYRGRIGIFEVLTISEKIEKMVLESGTENEIARQAIEEGMITMTQDGILKSIQGVTSIEEVSRITGQTEFLESMYESLMDQALSRKIIISPKDAEIVFQNISSLEKIGELIAHTGQKEVARYVFAAALFLGVGDIHIEPERESVKIRFRIDGILQTVAAIPLNEYPSFLGELKMLSGLKTIERGGVKDSRFSIEVDSSVEKIKEKKVDIRISIILGGFGETVVMRLLNQSSVSVDIKSLGIRKETLEKVLAEVGKPNGIFLNTGPTGSGKTTTLYSLLNILNTPEVKIITVEDPIEYQMPGVLQTQVNDEHGYSFPNALRALMRQNPDILMVGEIRDDETANIAIQSALTGHLVLSTIHTNDSSGAIPRLINMGARADDLAVAANAFMAQRLVRKLCDCKEKKEISEEEKKKIERVIKTISPKSGVAIPKAKDLFHPKGCEKCNGIGYKGRTTIAEVLVVDKEIKELVNQNALSFQIKDKAVENGMLTMAQDGILKVLEGETTLEEVERVTEI